MTLAQTTTPPRADHRSASRRVGVIGAVVLLAALGACASTASTVSPGATASATTRGGARAPGSAFADERRGAAAGEVAPAAVLFGAGARAGRWDGTYTTGAQRRGALILRLADGTAEGSGAVTGALALAVPPRASPFAGRSAGASAGARITVPVTRGHYAGGRLVLDTEPYYDAGCECTVTGTYQAVVRGDTLAGTYVTRGAATAAALRGRWRAVRAAADRP